MNRLDFKLYEWTKKSWTSQAARDEWESRITSVGQAFDNIESESVKYGIRDAFRTTVSPENLPSFTISMAKQGLNVIPTGRNGRSQETYSASFTPINDNGWDYTVLVTNRDIKDLPEEFNDIAMGQLLGYPECCIEFFQKQWNEEHYIDTTWPMIKNNQSDVAVVKDKKLYCNILLRWIGVRGVSHLPCSFDCDSTQELGKQYMELGQKLGYEEEVNYINEMLSWPVEWSALHGIAEIKTPIMKVSTNTDATGDKYTIRLHGDKYPDKGANGLVFPYQLQQGNVLTKGKAFRSFNMPEVKQEWYYKDNGFNSYVAQINHHRDLINLAKTIKPSKVLDLGCGNGALLLEMSEQIGIDDSDYTLLPYGCDLEHDKIANANKLLSQNKVNFVTSSMEDYEFQEQFDLIVHQPRHANDMQFTQGLTKHTKYIMLYRYDDDQLEIPILNGTTKLNEVHNKHINAILMEVN